MHDITGSSGGDWTLTDDYFLLLLLRPEPGQPAAQLEGPLRCGRYTVRLGISACASQQGATRAC